MARSSTPAAGPRAAAVLLVALLSAGLLLAGMFWLVGDHREPGLDGRAFDLLASSRGSLLARVAKPAAEVGPPLLALSSCSPSSSSCGTAPGATRPRS